MDNLKFNFDADVRCQRAEEPMSEAEALLRSGQFDSIDALSLCSTTSAAWGRRQKWQRRISRLKSYLSPGFPAIRRSSSPIGSYPGFDEYKRKQSDNSATTETTASFDFEVQSTPTALPHTSSLTEAQRSERRRSSTRLSRLNTRVADIAKGGFEKLGTSPEEKASRKEAKRQRRHERMNSAGTLRYADDMEAAQQYYGPCAYGAIDWRSTLAYMPIF